MRPVLIILLVVVLHLPSTVQAQNFAIVAVVNGEVITNFTLHERITMILASSNLQNKEDIRKRIAAQALQSLINEMLQAQHATELGLSVTSKDMDRAIADLEIRNSISPGEFEKFVASQGIPEDALMDQIRSQIIWKKIVARRIQPRINVSRFEIDETLEQIAHLETVNEVYLSEILLPIDKEKTKETMALLKVLLREIKDGASFSNLAEQFSQGSTASEGGVIGWVLEDQLGEEIREAVKNASAHDIVGPIRSEDGYRIIKVGNRRSQKPQTDETSIRNTLLLQKLELESKRYMKQLRQKAFIEIRL